MRKFRNEKRGETILETIIAMTILAMGVTMAGTIIGSSIRNINSSKNRIIAINIAREGIETIRNIRDTNWLKFSSKRRQCWNNNPLKVPTDGCPVNNEIQPGEYLVYRQGEYAVDSGDTFRWRLFNLLTNGGAIYPTAEPQDPIPANKIWRDNSKNATFIRIDEKWVDMSKLYLVDIDLNYDSDGDEDLTNDRDSYNHIYVGTDDDALGKDNSRKTVFKRTITIDYLTNSGQLISQIPIPLGDDHNRMRITARVSWQEGKNVFSSSLSTHITDYLGREVLTN